MAWDGLDPCLTPLPICEVSSSVMLLCFVVLPARSDEDLDELPWFSAHFPVQLMLRHTFETYKARAASPCTHSCDDKAKLGLLRFICSFTRVHHRLSRPEYEAGA